MLEKSITKHDEIITVLKDLYTSFNKVQIANYRQQGTDIHSLS